MGWHDFGGGVRLVNTELGFMSVASTLRPLRHVRLRLIETTEGAVGGFQVPRWGGGLAWGGSSAVR